MGIGIYKFLITVATRRCGAGNAFPAGSGNTEKSPTVLGEDWIFTR